MKKNIFHLTVEGKLDGEAIFSKMAGNVDAVRVCYDDKRTIIRNMTSGQSANLIAYCQWCGAKIIDVRAEEIA